MYMLHIFLYGYFSFYSKLSSLPNLNSFSFPYKQPIRETTTYYKIKYKKLPVIYFSFEATSNLLFYHVLVVRSPPWFVRKRRYLHAFFFFQISQWKRERERGGGGEFDVMGYLTGLKRRIMDGILGWAGYLKVHLFGVLLARWGRHLVHSSYRAHFS